MSYSFTEKKRIRKSFAKRASVLPSAFSAGHAVGLLYALSCRPMSPPRQRKNEGLQAAFTSIFPIVEPHRAMPVWISSAITLGEPPFDVKECQQRGLTFAAPLRAKVRLTIWTGKRPSRRSRKSRSRKCTWARFRS